MNVYLAGPMRGLPDRNIYSFQFYEAMVRRLGSHAFNPHLVDAVNGYSALEDKDFTREMLAEIITDDIKFLSECDCVLLLPGWRTSSGATVEFHAAEFLGIPCFDWNGCRIPQVLSPRRPDEHMARTNISLESSFRDFIGAKESWLNNDFGGFPSCKDFRPITITEAMHSIHHPVITEETRRECAKDMADLLKNACVTQDMPYDDILAEAYRLTTGDRQDQYGPPNSDFARVAAMWEVSFDRKFELWEVPVAMIELKISRIKHSPFKRDHWVDLCGYARCAWIMISQLLAEGKVHDRQTRVPKGNGNTGSKSCGGSCLHETLQ